MKNIIITLLFVSSFIGSEAQVNVENQAISNAGESYITSWGSLSVNIAGEPVIETISGGNAVFTQGFEQPKLKTVGIVNLPANAPSISLYPNPASNEVNVACTLPNSGKLAFRLFDMAGRELTGYVKPIQSGQQTEVLDLSSLSQGLYMLNIVFEGNDITKSFSIVKRLEVIK
jgi:hypothetical protein